MKYILGIDVGGTKIAAGLVDTKFRVSKVAVILTSQKDLLGQLARLIESYDDFSAIGLAVPGQILSNGIVTRLPNIKGFRPVNLKTYLEKKFKVPVGVINDAKAFAYAEAVIGAGKNCQSIAGVILGTGIGVGLVLNKKIYLGKDGIAGELEHVSLLDGKMLRDHRHVEGKFNYAKQAKKYLKTMLGMIVLGFNPELIVLGGGWSKLAGMEALANQLTVDMGGYKNITPVKISKLKYAGVIGAALTVLKK